MSYLIVRELRWLLIRDSTNVYFNVWSACLMSQGNTSSMWSSASWVEECRGKSLDVVSSNFKTDDGSTPQIPSWAYLQMPTNASFDILEAISRKLSHVPESKFRTAVTPSRSHTADRRSQGQSLVDHTSGNSHYRRRFPRRHIRYSLLSLSEEEIV